MDEEEIQLAEPVPSKKTLPFPVSVPAIVVRHNSPQLRVQVHSCQRRLLQRYKARAVAKEAELVARKKRQFEELKVYIHEAINEKNNRPKEPVQKVRIS